MLFECVVRHAWLIDKHNTGVADWEEVVSNVQFKQDTHEAQLYERNNSEVLMCELRTHNNDVEVNTPA